MSEILIINGNPKPHSLCKGLSKSYAQGVRDTGCNVNLVHISELNFNIDLEYGYDKNQEIENDLINLQTLLLKAMHIVIVSPTWWGTMPARLKGLFDRILLPDFAFKYEAGNPIPKKLLHGRTARIIVTMDSPIWYYKYFLGDPIIKTLKKPTLEHCGIRVSNVSRLGSVINSTDKMKKNWIQLARNLGVKDAKSIQSISR